MKKQKMAMDFEIIDNTLIAEMDDFHYKIWKKGVWNLEISKSFAGFDSTTTIYNLSYLQDALDEVEKHYRKVNK